MGKLTLAPEDMPERWAALEAEIERLTAEVGRLRAALQYARQALANISDSADLEVMRATAKVGLGMSVDQQSARDENESLLCGRGR